MMRAEKYLAPLANMLAQHAGHDIERAIRIALTAGINEINITKGSANDTWLSIVKAADSQGHASISELVHQTFKTIPNSEKQTKAEQLVDDYCRFLAQPLECPYPGGLQPFASHKKNDDIQYIYAGDTEEETAEEIDYTQYFYGRDTEVETVRQALEKYSYVVIFGMSGSGKSSLMRAKVMTEATQDYALFSKQPIYPSKITEDTLQLLRTVTHDDAHKKPLLITIDQFEEVYGTEIKVEPEELLSLIKYYRNLPAKKANEKKITVLICVRADFVNDLMKNTIWPSEPRQCIQVLPLEGEGLREAIYKPAEKLGVEIAPDLLQEIVSSAKVQSGSLPLVQEAMLRLWQKVIHREKKDCISLEDYESFSEEISGKNGNRSKKNVLTVVLSDNADRAFAKIPESQQKEKEIAKRIFLRMVEFTSGRTNVRRQQTFNELMSDDHSEDKLKETLAKLVEYRLITIDKPKEKNEVGDEFVRDKFINIAHEVLMTEWDQFKYWIEKDKDKELDRRNWENKAQQWQNRESGSDFLTRQQIANYEKWQEQNAIESLGISSTLKEFYSKSKEIDEDIKRRENKLIADKVKAEQAKRRTERITLLSMSGLSIVLMTIYLIIPEIWRQRAIGNSVYISDAIITSTHPISQPTVVPSFWLDQMEVSNDRYRLCYEQGPCRGQEPIGEEGRIQFGKSEYSNHPVVDITYLQAANFCTWLGMSLPTPYQLLAAYESPKAIISHMTPLTYFSEITSTITLTINNQPIYNLVGNASEMTHISASTLDKIFFNLLGGSFLSPRNKITIDDIEGKDPDRMNKNTSDKETGFRCATN